MANEFKVKKGLIVHGSGSTVLDIQGSQGQLFSITDDLTGTLFAVSDISGVPIFDVNADGTTTLDGNINLGDNNKIQLGASQDLQIYHNGNDSYIKDLGTGDLRIIASATKIYDADMSHLQATFTDGGAVDLYHGGNKKFETTSTGVEVTGGGTFAGDVTLTDGVLTVNDGNNYVKISEGTNSIGQIELKDGDPVFVQGWGSEFRVGVGTYDNTALTINSSKNATFAGEISQIYNPGNTGAFQYLKNVNAGNAAYVSKKWQNDDTGFGEIWRNSSTRNSGVGNTVSSFNMYNSADINFWSGANLSLTLDSSQNATFAGKIKTTSTATGAIELVGGTGVSTTGAFILRQNGNGAGNGMAITSGHATSHRIWKDASGNLNIGSSGNVDAFKQDISGNVTIEGDATLTNGQLTVTHDTNNVAKIIQAGTSMSNNTYTFEVDSSSHSSNMSSAGAMAVDVYGGRALTIDGKGDVGIGTSTPATLFHVKGDADDNESVLYIENTYSSGGVFFPAALFKHTASNHSYGTVAEFRTEGTSTDRPSILFSNGHNAKNWSVGQGVYGANDNFAIGYRSSHPNASGAWATAYLTINTSGTATFASSVTTGGNVTINTTADNILTLNQTSTNNKWNYINFNNQGAREWFIGQDASGNFNLYNDNIDSTAISVGYTNNAIDLNANTTVSGTFTATYLYGDGSNLTNVPPAAHNHNNIYYTETEIDTNFYGKTAIDAKFTSSDGSEDEWKFTLGDEGALTGNKWYKVAQVNQANGGLHIKGNLSNHVETFGTQKFDLLIQGREGDEIEISGTVDVLHNAAGTGTDKTGIRVIKSVQGTYYDQYDVYIRTTRYTQAKFHLTKFGSTVFYTTKPSVTSEPAPVSGGNVELDTSTLVEGNYVVDDSAPREIYHEGHLPTLAELGAAADTVENQTDFVSAANGGTFNGDVTAPSFIGKLMGGATGAPDATIWCVSGDYTDWGIFYDQDSPDVIQFKSSGNVKATISLDHGDYTGRNATFTGTVTAQEFHTEFVSASILYESGSTQFGDTTDDTHNFTGKTTLLGLGVDADPEDFNNVLTLAANVGPTTNDLGAGLFFKQKWYSASDQLINVGGIVGVKTNSSGNYGGGLAFFAQPDGAGDSFEVMRYNSSGNVGIGTSSPNQKLQVGGNLHVYDEEGDTDAAIFISTGTSDTTTVAIRSNGDSYFNGGNVGIGTTSPGAKLDVQPTASNRKVTRISNDVMSTYFYNSQVDAVLAWTCGSYHQAEVVITANQTNGGTYNNLYIRGIWSNNHTSHHWDELERIGGLTGSTFTMSVGQNGTTTNSGRLELDFNYINGSFSQLNVRVTDFYGTHSYSIT